MPRNLASGAGTGGLRSDRMSGVGMRNAQDSSSVVRAFVFAAAIGAACALFATPSLAAAAEACPGHPNALGTSRVLTIAPGEYWRLGLMQYKRTLPLADKEVVLTFDDGPLPPSTNHVLDTLASQCVQATFFLVGEMAHSFPSVVRRIHADGHTIGTHSEDHPNRFDKISLAKVRYEIDQGIANVGGALGDPKKVAPFFRIPGLGRTNAVEHELVARGLIVFSADVVADDWFRHIKPSEIVRRAMSRLEARGKGILLLHDIHPWTAKALPELLAQLKAHGFHVVHVVPGNTLGVMIADGLTPWSRDGGVPDWPQVADLPAAAAHSALPAPDAEAFDPGYRPWRAAKFADAALDDGPMSPDMPANAAATAAALPVPSIQDTGLSADAVEVVGPAVSLRSGLIPAEAKTAVATDPRRPQAN